MPGDSSAAMRRPSLQAPHRRQPPPTPPTPGQRSGPPSIGLDDPNEFDLGGGGGSPALELDFGGGPGKPPPSEPPPEIAMPKGMAPIGLPPRDPGIDLPGPVGMSAVGVDEDAGGYSLDLPAPVDILPQPVARPPAPSRGVPASSFAPPTAPPLARPPGGGPPAAGLPSFSSDLPVPVDLDLPTPATTPQPIDRLDLPLPDDLPTPGGHQMVAPAGYGMAPANYGVAPTGIDVAPSNLGVTPAELGITPAEIGVTPAEIGVTPVGLDMAPKGIGAPQAAASGADHSLPPFMPAPGQGQSPGPAAGRAVAKGPVTSGRPPVSRGLLIGVGGLALVGLAGAGVLYSGILDPVDPEPSVLRGGGKKAPEGETKGETQGETKQGGSAATPGGPAAERSAAVLATMATHTPAAYLQARTAATEAGDAVGAAECALLLHYHYGPNPALAAEAEAVLKAYASSTEPFVQRVVGLASLAAGDLDGAEGSLGGEGPRARLYRGWLHLQQGKLDEAKADADAVLAALADEVGAKHLGLAVAAARDPVAALPALQAAVQSNAHPALQALLGATALEAGRLAMGRAAVDALDPKATDDPGVQAWTHVQHARIRAAQGDASEALAAYDRAVALVPQASGVQVERIRTLVAAKRFTDASAAVSALVREHPKDLEIQLLQAEVAVQSGDGDVALQILDTLAKALPKDARVERLRGEVYAMRLAVDEGQAAFAAARALDELDDRIAISEAILLADAKRLPDALAVLEAARAKADAAGRPRDVARLLVTKAKLHDKAGETNAALEALGRALEAVPDDNEAQRLRGVLRLRQGEVAQGRADLVEVFERTGGFPGLAAPLGHLYVLANDYDALERLVGGRLRGEDTDDELLLLGVRLRLHQGRTDDARALVELALVRHPADWEAHMLQAQLLISEGKHTEALAEIELSRPATPQAELMLQRGKILEYNARHDDAIPEYRRALELDPNLHEARFLFGRLLHHKGGHGKAITELRKVLDAPGAKSAPWFPEVWMCVGQAQQAQGKYADAIESLKQATTLDPTLGEAWANMGEYHENLNKHAEAIAALTKAAELGTEGDHWYADALMNLGRAQAKSGKKGAARKTLEKFLKVAPAESTSRAEAERLLASL
ncbi:MAG: tetratricopeptide repeat protein [Myxococcales bacterium]|nr:tetratricopeptide repeat protein [Myxococcales bacterium]